MQFFSYIFDSRYADVIGLYNFVFLAVVILGFLGSDDTKIIKKKYKKVFFICSFSVATLFYVFSNTGMDLIQYVNRYMEAQLSTAYLTKQTMEAGYLLLNAVLKLVIEDPFMGIGVIKLISMILVFDSIYELRNEINVGYSILFYMSLFYFQGFNLIRLTLSGAICFFAFVRLYKEKYISAFIAVLIAISIHTSAILFLIAIVSFVVFTRMPRWRTVLMPILFLITLLMIVLGKGIITYFISSGSFLRYEQYMDVVGSAGIMQIVFYVPVFIIMYCMWRLFKTTQWRFVSLALLFCLFGFMFAMIGYDIGIVSRAAIYFGMNFTVLIPFYMKWKKSTNKRGLFAYDVIAVSITTYAVVRYILTMSSIFVVSGLSHHAFLF